MSEAGELQKILDQGVDQGVAPAMVLLLWQGHGPRHLLAAGQAQVDTVFDLASLTKPLATAPLALELEQEGVLPWSADLGGLWGGAVPADKEAITVRQLLTHAAGYPAYEPYYQALQRVLPAVRPGLLKAMLMNEPLLSPPGRQAVYSDLGYLLLGLLLAEGFGQGLEHSLTGLYQRLGVEGPCYLPLGRPLPWPLGRIAPCGRQPDRQEIHGQVEDENAFFLGGVAGHAGLFGSAGQVAAVTDALCRAAQGQGPWPAAAAARLFAVDQDTPGSGRTPGFDTPSGPASAAGPNAPAGTVGHLGFTGCSLWWHPASNRGVVLLTNRVALGRDNDKIHSFRRQVHELAWRALD
ncbi:MAG: serine hydrolase domain-containing protein [Thermodesulfobacteriota bacterium]